MMPSLRSAYLSTVPGALLIHNMKQEAAQTPPPRQPSTPPETQHQRDFQARVTGEQGGSVGPGGRSMHPERVSRRTVKLVERSGRSLVTRELC